MALAISNHIISIYLRCKALGGLMSARICANGDIDDLMSFTSHGRPTASLGMGKL